MSTNKAATKSSFADPTGFRPNLWHLSLILVVLGLGVSGYLSYAKLSDTELVCANTGEINCEVVENSSYAELFGIPIAYLGFATYFLLGVIMILERRVAFFAENGVLILFGITCFAFVYSMYLVYVQGEVLEAWCQWCLVHETIMTILFIVTSVRLYRLLTTEID